MKDQTYQALTTFRKFTKLQRTQSLLFVESFTADHKPLLGEDPAVRGFYHGCGFNSGGMMLSA